MSKIDVFLRGMWFVEVYNPDVEDWCLCVVSWGTMILGYLQGMLKIVPPWRISIED